MVGMYRSPVTTEVTSGTCDYGCQRPAKFSFMNGKLCCSKHQNSCQGKRDAFSNRDHSVRTAKSLKTRIATGVTKSSQVTAGKTRVESGHYDRLAVKMRQHWEDHPWSNSLHCPILPFEGLSLVYQGSYELNFLNDLLDRFGIDWIRENVSRGPSIRYIDPTDNTERLYISDFIIGGTVYEIKSDWTWNGNGSNQVLEKKNMAKLRTMARHGYNVVLVKEMKEHHGIVD